MHRGPSYCIMFVVLQEIVRPFLSKEFSYVLNDINVHKHKLGAAELSIINRVNANRYKTHRDSDKNSSLYYHNKLVPRLKNLNENERYPANEG